MTIGRRVHYSGRVQGVGFRYAALRLAQGHAVQGLVRNLPDGRVEMVVEGECAEVERFLEAVRRNMDGYIEATTIEDEPPQGFTDFRIGY
jgi:acylphosphatase